MVKVGNLEDGEDAVEIRKNKKIIEILHDMRPGIGKYCWDKTIIKGNEEPEKPEEITNARIEIEEEITQKLTDGFDQMHVEDVADDEEVEFIELVPVPDSEDSTGKAKMQSKITS